MLICAIRTVIIYMLVVTAIRIMGKRQIGELRPSELVVALLIADLAAVPMQETGTPLLHGILPMCILVALELLLSGIMLKFPKMERLIGGNPIPIIENGVLNMTALKKLRLSVDDLMEALRMQDCFDISTVAYAVVESNGHITPYLRPAARPATAGDVAASSPDTGMPAPVITDGAFCPWGLALAGKSEQTVSAFLIRQKILQKDVLLMTLSPGGTYILVTTEGKTLRGEERF